MRSRPAGDTTEGKPDLPQKRARPPATTISAKATSQPPKPSPSGPVSLRPLMSTGPWQDGAPAHFESLPAPGAGAEQGQRGQDERHDRAARTAKLTSAESAESATDGPNPADQALTSNAACARSSRPSITGSLVRKELRYLLIC